MGLKWEKWQEKVKNAPVPSYFKALLIESSVRKPLMTSEGIIYRNYSDAGYELARHISEYVEEKALEELDKIYSESLEVDKWLRKYTKRFYELVPSKRKSMFIRGFMRRFEEFE